MTGNLPRVDMENGGTLTPETVVRSDCGRWVSCIYETRVERVPARRVAGIVEEVEEAPDP